MCVCFLLPLKVMNVVKASHDALTSTEEEEEDDSGQAGFLTNQRAASYGDAANHNQGFFCPTWWNQDLVPEDDRPQVVT